MTTLVDFEAWSKEQVKTIDLDVMENKAAFANEQALAKYVMERMGREDGDEVAGNAWLRGDMSGAGREKREGGSWALNVIRKALVISHQKSMISTGLMLLPSSRQGCARRPIPRPRCGSSPRPDINEDHLLASHPFHAQTVGKRQFALWPTYRRRAKHDSRCASRAGPSHHGARTDHLSCLS